MKMVEDEMKVEDETKMKVEEETKMEVGCSDFVLAVFQGPSLSMSLFSSVPIPLLSHPPAPSQ